MLPHLAGYYEMRNTLTALLLSFTCLISQAQLYDAKWNMGDSPITLLDFTTDSVKLDSIKSPYSFFLTNAGICDENGTFLYSTNGVFVFDKNGDTLLNGTGINPCSYTQTYICCGLNFLQAALFIPHPGNSRYYYLFHFSADDADSTRPATIYFSLIDKQGNGGLGAVVTKNVSIFHTTRLRGGGMTACKHANGRDYWLIMGGSVVNTFYKFLVTPNGIEGPYTQNIGPQFPGPFDNAYSRFSQDGSKYVTGVYEGPILVMDFDRCTGEFSNPITIYNECCPNAPSCSGSSSVEISPNNRFVYVANVINLTQYDLWATNIQDSIEIYSVNSSQFAQLFMLQLAPDGKIYLSTWSGTPTLDSIHVINNPNAKGDSCNFKYASQPTLTHNAIAVPNMANYRLGPLLASGCDTITATTTTPIVNDNTVRVYPNPAKQSINLDFNINTNGNVEFDLIDELGVTAIKELLNATQGYTQFDIGNLSSGPYYWVLKDNTRAIKTGKVAIIK